MTVEEAQRRLKDLIAEIVPGEKLVITLGGEPVAELIRLSQGTHPQRVDFERAKLTPRRPGSCKGKLTILMDDDDHLRDWAEYMPYVAVR
jgi:antitoxin (DNA-binding transcriptional repressor) of toxin-antitoxin stability system